MLNSPFKFLDSYTQSDIDIFFGREAEIEEVYSRLFFSKLLLVYGPSGTGKTSLLKCGVSNRFGEQNWKPIFIRRKQNIVQSIHSELNKQAITKLEDNKPINEKLYSLYLDYLTPVYLVLDQFEELFIFGSEDEKTEFVVILKEILSDEKINTQVILSIREEYLANLSEFEDALPQLFENRIRIEKMKKAQAMDAIDGPCKYAGVNLESDVGGKVMQRLSTNSGYIELTWLQVVMDNLYKKSLERNPQQLIIRDQDVDQLGKMGDVLSNFLDEQLKAMDDGEKGEAILKTLISPDGTKKQLTIAETEASLQSHGHQLSRNEILKTLQHFIKVRIISDKDENGRYELKHDSLAAKVYKKLTLDEKELVEIRQFIENAYQHFLNRKILLRDEDLNYISPYQSKLILKPELSNFIKNSKRELIKNRKRKRNYWISGALVIIFILLGFTLWAVIEKNKAINERQASRALYYNILSNEIRESDPTKAFRILEYANRLNSKNDMIYDNLRRTYNENPPYKIISNIQDQYTDRYSNITISPNEKQILTLNKYRSAIYLRGLEGNILQVIGGGYGWDIFYANFSKEGDYIVTGSFDNIARLWDLSGNLLHVYKGHTAPVSFVAVSPTQEYVLTASWDKTARLWDMEGNLLEVLDHYEGDISFINFSPDGKFIITCEKNKANLWNLNGELLQVFDGHVDLITSATFSPDGEFILTGSNDKTARLWNTYGTELVILKGHKGRITTVCFSPDAKSILTGSNDKSLILWDTEGNIKQIYKGHTDAIHYVSFSIDKTYAISCSNDNTIRKWPINNYSLLINRGHKGAVTSICISPDGEKIITGSVDKTAQILDYRGNMIQLFTGHNNVITSASFSPDGSMIVTGSYDSTICLWDSNGRKLKEFKNQNDIVLSTCFSNDGHWILAGTAGNSAKLYDLKGNLIQSFYGHKSGILSVNFSPNGKEVLTGSWDGTARLWSISGKQLQLFKGHSLAISSAVFSPSGKTILTGSFDKTARLWDLNGNQLNFLKGHSGFIHSVNFSPDGKTLITASEDKTIKLWDISGRLVQSFDEYNSPIHATCFARDGKSLFFGCIDGTVHRNEFDSDFSESNYGKFENLSIEDELLWEILDFKDVRDLNDSFLTERAATYYLKNRNNVTTTNDYIESLKKAKLLFEKSWKQNPSFSSIIGYTSSLLYEYNTDSLNKPEIDIIFHNLIESDSTELLIEIGNFYVELSSNDIGNKFNLHDKAQKVFNKVIRIENQKNDIRQKIGQDCSNISWKMLLENNFKDALEYSELAKKANPALKYLYKNLALSNLLNNKWEQANEIYLTWQDSTFNNEGTNVIMGEAFLEDLIEMEKVGIKHPDFVKVRKLLKHDYYYN